MFAGGLVWYYVVLGCNWGSLQYGSILLGIGYLLFRS